MSFHGRILQSGRQTCGGNASRSMWSRSVANNLRVTANSDGYHQSVCDHLSFDTAQLLNDGMMNRVRTANVFSLFYLFNIANKKD